MIPQYKTPVLKIPNATETLKDPAQYMIYLGVKQYNLCMQFCVAYCMQDIAFTNNIDDFLKYWEVTDIKWWNTIFKDKRSRTTGIYDIKKALSAYNVVPQDWKDIPVNIVSFNQKLKTHRAIIGVKVDYTGYLVYSGIPHWIVLESLDIADENHAIIKIYNSFTNFIEPYSWKELMISTGSYKQGVWIPR
jgi:hypothetical protein